MAAMLPGKLRQALVQPLAEPPPDLFSELREKGFAVPASRQVLNQYKR